ncbi:hypothetical protein K2173_001481 [Erythroxylum novogranatense]|uniref:Protein Jade-1 n=1 Tax=Erythroxylum novogranatense TaxID=1862640 RepID=A0AAV8U970_9ROSI|nr:hypothetical protein K2173_001481 [Erythroxylum novogranatense]
MDSQFQALPPLKRFSLLQKHQPVEDDKENAHMTLHLPTKKRKESRSQAFPDPTTISTAYCLPAKKRVWALQSDLVSGKPLLPLDLNVEYKPCFDEEQKGVSANLFVETRRPDNEEKTPLAGSDEQSFGTPREERKEPFICGNTSSEDNGETEKDEGTLESREEDDDYDDGILCAICQSTDGDPADPIVFCDGCDLMVHTTCYGNPLIKGIPEGDWFCTQCMLSQSKEQKKPLSCRLCPDKSGAMKPTVAGSWAHVVCALLVPEVFFEDPDGREGIDLSRIPKWRWGGKCYVCKNRKGCVIECSEPRCSLAFHVTCALNGGLCIEYQEGRKNKEAIVAGFCKNHTELWKKQQQTGRFKIVARVHK